VSETEPYETLFGEEHEEISAPGCGKLVLPRYGCSTVCEEREFRRIYSAIDREKIKNQDIEADLDLKIDVCTVVIKSRLDPNWNREKTLARVWDLPQGKVIGGMLLLEKLFDFWATHEMNRGKVSVEQKDSAPKKPSSGTKSTGG
jgi:hypothetical protein